MNAGTKNSPLVTIAIPTFNRADYLIEAIQSALAQTYGNIEVLISDNCSTDDTLSVIRFALKSDTRVRILTQTSNIGMVGNWNACLEAARGEFFLLLSDDDLLEPNCGRIVAKWVNGTSNHCVAYGKVAYIGVRRGNSSLGAPEIESGSEMVAGYSRGERVAYPSATLVRTADARDCGGYPDTGTATDLALLLLLLRDNRKVRFFDQPVARYRVHESALSFSESAATSYLTLYEWLQHEGSLPPDWIPIMQEYCRGGIHRWGWSQSLLGNDSGGSRAAEILENMHRSSKYRFFTRTFVHFPPN